MANLLVVYPDTQIRRLLTRIIRERGHDVSLFNGPEEISQLSKHPLEKGDRFDFVLLGDIKDSDAERLFAQLPIGTKHGWLLPERQFPHRRLWGEFIERQPFSVSALVDKIESTLPR